MSPESLARIFEDLAALARARLGPRVKAVFDGADDSLFELAEHTVDGVRQQAFFQGMRACRRQRAAVEREFLDRVGRLLALSRPVRHAGQPGSERLSLVGEEELEEQLALSTMVSRAEAQFARPLHALNQRFAFMLTDPGLGDASNPVGPARLAEAFHAAMSGLELDTEAQLVVLKLFERQVLGGLDPLYSEINIRLADAGILPTLSASAPVRPSPPPAPPPRPATAGRPAARPLHAADPAREAALFEQVMALLARGARGRQGAAGDGAPRTGGGVALPPGMVLGALGRLQQQIAAASGNSETIPPRALKAELLQESRRLGGDGALAPEAENTIDLMGLLFDYVGTDDNLPDPMQQVLARLHLPLLRAALHDPRVLVETGHPARQLLDELGTAAVGWSPAADPGQRLLTRIRDTVDQLLGKFEGDTAMFDRLLREFRGFVDASRRRAELAEQRAVEAALGRERLKLARRHVRGALGARLQDLEVLPWIRHLVLRPWANYLVLLWLRQGETSTPYQEAIGFVDSLLWVAQAGASEDERLRLRTLLPEMEAQLRQGLATVAYHESEVEELAAELRDLVRWRLGEETTTSFRSREHDAGLQDPEFGREAEADQLEEQPSPEDVDPEVVDRIRALAPGTWFEFRVEEGDAERAKLSWISPISGRCLFTNRTGLKVAELSPEAVAQEVERGLARIIEGATLLQRALASALQRLQELHGADPGARQPGRPDGTGEGRP